MCALKIGIIGGSGLDDPDILHNASEKHVDTPFGKPSDALKTGEIAGVPCVLLARHGRKHNISPTNVNYRANLFALKQEGCTHIIVTTACGSLREEIKPGDVVILDQFIDRTTRREVSFFDGKVPGFGVCHIPCGQPYCPKLREVLIGVTKELNIPCHPVGTSICIEGPRFSSKAESHLYRSWGAHTVNMTTCPEVYLAKELGLCYAAVALPTDYDCWHETNASVNVELVLKTFAENRDKATSLIIAAVKKLASISAEERTRHLKEHAEDVRCGTMSP